MSPRIDCVVVVVVVVAVVVAVVGVVVVVIIGGGGGGRTKRLHARDAAACRPPYNSTPTTLSETPSGS